MRLEADKDLIDKALEVLFDALSPYDVRIMNKEVVIPVIKWGKFVKQE